MGAAGAGRVISALCAVPKMRAKAYISALPKLIDQGIKDEAYRIYITDALKVISENTAKFASGQFMTKRYAELYDVPPKETRTGAEIAADVIKKAGLIVK